MIILPSWYCSYHLYGTIYLCGKIIHAMNGINLFDYPTHIFAITGEWQPIYRLKNIENCSLINGTDLCHQKKLENFPLKLFL